MVRPARQWKSGDSRRGAGEGSVYQRADGIWVATVEAGKDADGKRQRKVVKAKTKAEALRKLDDARKRVMSGQPVLDGRRSTGDYLTWWIDEVLPGTVKGSTAAGYRTVADRYVIPHVGDVPLVRLAPAHVQTMMRALEEAGLSARTRQYARAVLRRALGHAVRFDLVTRNVAALVESPKGAATKLDDALSADEARRVLDAARGDRLEALYVLALTLGLRRGELLGLRWSDLDLSGVTVNGDEAPSGSLTVAQTLTRVSGQGLVVSSPKTDAGARTVPLVGRCRPALLAHRDAQAVERETAGTAWTATGHVFVTPLGDLIDPANLYHRWQRLCTVAGIGKRRLHATRHTAATIMLDQGVPLEVVSSILGHASLAITADVYARPTQDAKRRGLTALAAAFDS